MFIDFREKGKEGGKEGERRKRGRDGERGRDRERCEKHWSVAVCMCPDWGSNLKSSGLWGGTPTNWATQQGQGWTLFRMKRELLKIPPGQQMSKASCDALSPYSYRTLINSVKIPSGCVPRRGFARPGNIYIHLVCYYHQGPLLNFYTGLHPHQQYMSIPMVPHLCQHLALS